MAALHFGGGKFTTYPHIMNVTVVVEDLKIFLFDIFLSNTCSRLFIFVDLIIVC